jgi:hypothetical protein
MSKPVFVLLHGAWHTPKCWDRLIAELDQAGYSSVAPALPSSNADPLPSDWSQDLETIRKTVSDLVDVKGQDVVVVMHSFSGMTGGTALDGFDKESRASKGLEGGVVRLVYVSAFLVPEGFQHSPQGTRDNMIPEMKTDFEVRPIPPSFSFLTNDSTFLLLQTGAITVSSEDVKDMFHQDMDDKTSKELGKDLRPQSLGSYWGTTTHAAWRHIPTTYIICNGDRPSTVQAIHYLIATAKVDCIELKMWLRLMLVILFSSASPSGQPKLS